MLRAKHADISTALGHDAGRFVQASIAAIVGDPSLAECTPESIVRAVQACADMGAVPSTRATPQTERRIALIARQKRGKVGGQWVTLATELTVQPEFRFYQEVFGALVGPAGSARAALVLTGDAFEFDELEQEVVRHQRDPFRSVTYETRDQLLGGYLALHMSDGRRRVFLVPREAFDRAMGASESYKAAVDESKRSSSSPWISDYNAMCLKTVWLYVARREGAALFAHMRSEGARLGAAVRENDISEGVVTVEVEELRLPSASDVARKARDLEQRALRSGMTPAQVSRAAQTASAGRHDRAAKLSEPEHVDAFEDELARTVEEAVPEPATGPPEGHLLHGVGSDWLADEEERRSRPWSEWTEDETCVVCEEWAEACAADAAMGGV
jgi:recombinational DNA repair protein RecT